MTRDRTEVPIPPPAVQSVTRLQAAGINAMRTSTVRRSIEQRILRESGSALPALLGAVRWDEPGTGP
jgi:hypothetical protein